MSYAPSPLLTVSQAGGLPNSTHSRYIIIHIDKSNVNKIQYQGKEKGSWEPF